MNPKISIIVPVYNVEKYLNRCLDSILAQTFIDWECILVDDGSKDFSGKICDEYAAKDSRFKVFHKENGGVSSARNTGLKHVESDWITFVDADDLIGFHYIDDLYKPIAYGHKVDFVQCGCTNYENESPTTIKCKYDYYIGNDSEVLFLNIFGHPFSKLFKREIIENREFLNFDEGMKIYEDLAFTIDYLLRIKYFALIESVSYYYRLDNNNSAMHVIRFDNYEFAKYTHKHLRDSILAAIELFNLPREKFYRHFSMRLSCMMMVNAMYNEGLPRKNRIINLKTDLLPIDYQLLEYCTFKRKIHLFLSFLLRKKKYLFFDLFLSVLSMRRKCNLKANKLS